ncbi:hypothetical protein [Xenorhabdus bovienii]|uniref:hypothetical protein n=1 Tax=Xenorhabdus bovienii TaxID=40576 RepID=UPI00061D106C|nr:hypothetical protein [Xenorhabdus bovienii]MCG3469332.1 hypothetical protein [Xenorhabdus bovienii]
MDNKNELIQKISELLVDNPVRLEDKLAMMMIFCFQLMSSSKTDGVNMRISDGQTLTLKLESRELKY